MTKEQENIAALKAKYLEYYHTLPVQKYAAMSIGRNEDTIILWKTKDSEFSDKIQIARAEWVQEKADKVRPEFSLERLESEVFGEKPKTIKLEVNVVQEILMAAG